MRFAREGYPFIAAGLIISGAAWTATWALERPGGWMWSAAAGILSALTLFVIWFFRDPDHALPADATHVVAPGQGKVIVVEEVDEATFMRGRCRKISIFLSIFDVHVQRAPVTGTVAHRVYRPGAYAVAWRDKASEDNEQASLGFATERGRVLVRQIAGFVARRIVTYPREGQTVGRGDRIGIIRFGSRVDLFLPLDWEMTCAVGDRVVAGLTVLARQPSTRSGGAQPVGNEEAGSVRS
jgi:phosphatidylserine decarboxylase